MEQKRIELIGAAFGWGAQRHEAQGGPQALKEYGLLQVLQKQSNQIDWKTMLLPSREYFGDKLEYADRLEQVENYVQRLSAVVFESVQKNHFPVILGGDHSIAIGSWSGIITALNAKQAFGLIWIDAHMDAHTPKTTPSHAIHGMPLAVLLGKGESTLVNTGSIGEKISPKHLVLIGVRSFEAEEAALLKNLNVKIYFMEEIKEKGFNTIFQEAVSIVSHNTKGFGISVDLDAFDPSVVSGTGSPVPNGIWVEDVMAALTHIKYNPKFKALEIAEFDPTRDSNHQTLSVIQNLILSIL